MNSTTRVTGLVTACVGAVALVALVALAQPASAHAILRSTTPADSETLDQAPQQVSLEFNEPVSTTAGGVRVFNSDGERVDVGDATAAAETKSVTVGVQPDLSDGTYVVAWRALSADAHPVHGAFVFTVGAPDADDDAIAEILQGSDDGALQLIAALLRFVTYAAALLAAGGVLFLVWVHDRDAGEQPLIVRTVVRAAAVTAVAGVAGLVVQAALVTGLGVTSILSATTALDVATSSYGVSAVVMLAALAVLTVGLRRLWSGSAVVMAAAGAVMLLVSFALTGHTATSTPRWLVVTADVVHTAAATAWFAGLVLLAMVLRRRRLADDAAGGAAVISRFSTLATGAILAVSLAGVALGWVEVRATRALWSTAYGITLVVKVALVGIVLVIGAYNKRRLVPAIRRAGTEAWARLRTTVRFEAAALCLVIAVTAVLVNLVPARDAAGITGPLSVRQAVGDDYLVDLTVDPNRAGRNEMHIYLFTADGRTADDIEDITVGLSMPSKDIGPIEREPTPTGPGHWTLNAAELPIAGRWIVTVSAPVTQFETITTDIPIDIGT